MFVSYNLFIHLSSIFSREAYEISAKMAEMENIRDNAK